MIVFGHVFLLMMSTVLSTIHQYYYIKLYHIDLLVEGELDDDVTRINSDHADRRVSKLEFPLRILLHLKKRTMMQWIDL